MFHLWPNNFPPGLGVRQIDSLPAEHELAGLDRGEWKAIELAKQIQANLLLIDERAGGRVAREQGFRVTGTLFVLVEAARSGLISIDEALARLAQTNFRRDPATVGRGSRVPQKRCLTYLVVLVGRFRRTPETPGFEPVHKRLR